MKNKNGQLIKDSQYLTLQTAKKTKFCQVLWNVWSCCLRKNNWARELVHCGHHMFFPHCDCKYGFSELLLV